MRTLEELRREIDVIDSGIVPLLVRRLALAGEIAAVKRAAGRPAEDPAREESVLGSFAAAVPAGSLDAVRAVYRTLFREMKAAQSRV